MTSSTSSPTCKRRTAREPQAEAQAHVSAAAAHGPSGMRERKPSKLDEVEALLCQENGASIAEMVTATGWQQHSVRGAVASALKKRGLVITSNKVAGVRRYRGERSA